MHDKSDGCYRQRGLETHYTDGLLILYEHRAGPYELGLDQLSLTTAKDKVIKDEVFNLAGQPLQLTGRMRLPLLLNLIVNTWIKIRGHSTARVWLESYKLQQKKQLISSTSSASTSSE